MRRLVLLSLLASTAMLAPSADAKPKPQIEDPTGDYPVAGADIVSVTFSTEGKKLVIEMQLAGTPNSPVPYGYQVTFEAGDCVWRGHIFGATGGTGGGCRDDDSAAPSSVVIKENIVTITVPASGRLKPGTTLTTLGANNSVGGVLVGGGAENTGDLAKSDKKYVVGSNS